MSPTVSLNSQDGKQPEGVHKMKSQLSLAKILEMGANASIIIAAILFSAVLAKTYLGQPPERKDQPSPPPVTQKLVQKGDVLNISKVDWRNGQTLLLALSTSCHFCTESAPFYRRLMKEHGDTRLVAVFPQENGEGERYLSNLGVRVDEVEQASFGDPGISGTPTLILVDSGGKVIGKWEGALPPTREGEVIAQLKEETARNR
jgi:thioredoxin-related protein